MAAGDPPSTHDGGMSPTTCPSPTTTISARRREQRETVPVDPESTSLSNFNDGRSSVGRDSPGDSELIGGMKCVDLRYPAAAVAPMLSCKLSIPAVTSLMKSPMYRMARLPSGKTSAATGKS